VDTACFHPELPTAAFRTSHAVPDGTVVLVYAGAVHPANVNEVRRVYEAAALLHDAGVPAVLLRSGMDLVPALRDDVRWAGAPWLRSLGWLPPDEVPTLLAAADVLVQPGPPGRYNDHRLPSKLPEYLASGRPVVLPRTNLGLVLEPDVEAVVLDDADGPAIAAAVTELREDPDRCASIGAAGRRFAETHLRWREQVGRLVEVYEGVLARAR
jgi:glycosyltransferase involved in cell wall biosynthesis